MMNNQASPNAPDKSTAELDALHEFSMALSDARTLNEALDILLWTSMGTTRVSSSAVLLAEGDTEFRVTVRRGPSAWARDRVSIPPEQAKSEFFLVGPGAAAPPAGLDQAHCRLCVPMHRLGKVVGAICLGPKPKDEPFAEREILFVQSLGKLASVLIENDLMIRRLEDVRRKLQLKIIQLDSLFDATSGFNITTDRKEILRILVSTLMGLLGLNRCAVLFSGREGLELAYQRGLRAIEADVDQLKSTNLEALGIDRGLDLDAGPPAGVDAEFLDLLRRWEIRQVLPVSTGERLRALILLGRLADGRDLEPDDVSFIQTVGEYALVSLDNRRLHLEMLDRERMLRELAIAREIQLRILPNAPPVVPGYDVAARATPCREVGGDYYDFLVAPEKSTLGIAVADVSGKSVPASLLMAFAAATFRALFHGGHTAPADLMARLNRALTESSGENRFMSFFYGRLSSSDGTLRFSNGGHNPPFLLRRDGSSDKLKTGGLVLGFLPDAHYQEETATLDPGDILVLYTDGVTEVFDAADKEFGEDRLFDVIRASAGLSAEQILDRVFSEISRFNGGAPLTDDATLIVIRRVSDPDGMS